MESILLQPIAARRRRTDKTMRALLLAGLVVALIPLVLVIYYLLHEGVKSWHSGFFTTDPTGAFYGAQGGIRSAICGSLLIIALATVIAVPIGIAVAVFLSEYGRDSKFANTIRYFVDVMTGVPSIVFGLFIYVSLVETHFGGSSFAAWKGSVAVSLLMLPVVIRSSEVVLLLVPESLRESALALGAPRWRVIWKVVLPTARSGLITGSLLAIARGMGETAPLLFTVASVNGLSWGLNGSVNSLPLQIYSDIASPQAALRARAWGAALTLVLIILVLNLIARTVARRSRFA